MYAQDQQNERIALSPEIFELLRKTGGVINPVTMVATVDPDGAPRIAPFGSVRAISPQVLRLVSLRYHNTYANLLRDDRVVVGVVAPPDVAVSISGRARVVKDQMDTDANSAIVEIDIQDVKNDMVRSGVIESGIGFAPKQEVQGWFDAALAELESL